MRLQADPPRAFAALEAFASGRSPPTGPALWRLALAADRERRVTGCWGGEGSAARTAWVLERLALQPYAAEAIPAYALRLREGLAQRTPEAWRWGWAAHQRPGLSAVDVHRARRAAGELGTRRQRRARRG